MRVFAVVADNGEFPCICLVAMRQGPSGQIKGMKVASALPENVLPVTKNLGQTPILPNR